MGMKPKPVKVRVRRWWCDEYDVVFVFDGKRFRTNRLFRDKEIAQTLADKLQAVFDKAGV